MTHVSLNQGALLRSWTEAWKTEGSEAKFSTG